jgi:hypothetical protein
MIAEINGLDVDKKSGSGLPTLVEQLVIYNRFLPTYSLHSPQKMTALV